MNFYDLPKIRKQAKQPITLERTNKETMKTENINRPISKEQLERIHRAYLTDPTIQALNNQKEKIMFYAKRGMNSNGEIIYFMSYDEKRTIDQIDTFLADYKATYYSECFI